MLKGFFSFLLLSGLYVFLTSFAVTYIKSIDPVMLSIKNNVDKYEVKSVDAVVNEFDVIPGKNGLSVDIDKSYSLMKKYGDFNDKLLVYKDVKPDISIFDIYDKYISSGNLDKREVTFIFKLNDKRYVKEIVNILKEKNVIGTFFLDDDLIYDKDFIIYLYTNNQEIEFFSNNYNLDNLKMAYRYVSGYINKNLSYCYNDSYNKNNIMNCGCRKMHMIIPSINTTKNPFHSIKENLNNGSIIKLENNNSVILELRHVINFIRQKNYKIVSLKKMLEE